MSGPLVAVVDYDMGNRRSVEKALVHLGAQATITRDHRVLAEADAIVLPGVGAFPKGVANLRRYGLDTVVREQAAAGKPLLGICLGMQLLFDSSTELGELTQGLSLIHGEVRELHAGGLRVPHIGWNEVRFQRESQLTDWPSASSAPYYHVHSFVAVPADPASVIATAEYGERFATIVQAGNVHGTQFHPEKSSRDGLALLRGFLALTAVTARATVNA
jgi:glutamine amidotransferase